VSKIILTPSQCDVYPLMQSLIMLDSIERAFGKMTQDLNQVQNVN